MSWELVKYSPPDFKEEKYTKAPDACLLPAPREGVAPENYHATSIFPEYYKVNGHWVLAAKSRMDCVAVLAESGIQVKEFRRLQKGDMVFVGRSEDAQEGIFVHADGFAALQDTPTENFAFRQQSRSRETSFSMDYDYLYQLLQYEKQHGNIVWVMGPACTFDSDSRNAFAGLVSGGYVHAVLAGNALATHDLEGAYKKTALGQDIYTQKSYPNGHYNHIDTINRARLHGSIQAFLKEENIRDGIMHACVQCDVPFVLTGSIRDDGPLPGVYADVYEGQNAMRAHVENATTIICMATALHTIAAGNMAPSFRVLPNGDLRQVYFYSVDVSEFAVNKLGDRGSLSAKGIVTNVQDFIVNVSKGLGCY